MFKHTVDKTGKDVVFASDLSSVTQRTQISVYFLNLLILAY